MQRSRNNIPTAFARTDTNGAEDIEVADFIATHAWLKKRWLWTRRDSLNCSSLWRSAKIDRVGLIYYGVRKKATFCKLRFSNKPTMMNIIQLLSIVFLTCVWLFVVFDFWTSVDVFVKLSSSRSSYFSVFSSVLNISAENSDRLAEVCQVCTYMDGLAMSSSNILQHNE